VPEYAKDVLVEPEWLEQHLDDDAIRIVEVDENPALYTERHTPGAIGLDWTRDLQDPAPSPAEPRGRRPWRRAHASSSGSMRSNRSARILAVAPQIRWSPTT
jgi:3-mercaptopyruvate sulfurtransferase SseA